MRVRGSENNIGDCCCYGFGSRKLIWGEGSTLKSPADAGSLLGRSTPTEEDILHTDNLPRFDGILSAEESESMLSYLTVDYIRQPLIAHFFADVQDVIDPKTGEVGHECGNRVTFLFNERLQDLFRAVLLEQSTWVPDSDENRKLLDRVPMRRNESQMAEAARFLRKDALAMKEEPCLGSATGALLNELKVSPMAILSPLIAMLRYTEDLGKTGFHSAAAGFVLYLTRIAVVVEEFMIYVSKKETESSRNSLLKTRKYVPTINIQL